MKFEGFVLDGTVRVHCKSQVSASIQSNSAGVRNWHYFLFGFKPFNRLLAIEFLSKIWKTPGKYTHFRCVLCMQAQIPFPKTLNKSGGYFNVRIHHLISDTALLKILFS